VKQITPIIKKTRVHTERYEICPHCKKEIQEKSIFVDDENYVYHRPCMSKGPIDKIKPASKEDVDKAWKNGIEGFSKFFLNEKSAKTTNVQKTAQTNETRQYFGTIEKNISGVDYTIKWRTDVNGTQKTTQVFKPDEMPDYMWYQVKETMESEATETSNKTISKTASIIKQKPTSWFERAAKSLEKDDETTIDDGFLADGLGAFLDVFINYHSGPEGDKLAKWIIEVCKDPKYSKVADKLQKFHELTSEIYDDIVELAKNDDKKSKKVASLFSKTTKTNDRITQ
jgi:hypothetical protein